MTGPGRVLWSLVCSSARCRSRWSAAWDVVAHAREAVRCGDAPVRDGLDPAAVIPGVCPRRGHADRGRSGWASSQKHWPYKAWSRILSFRHFPPSPFREDLIDLPDRELGAPQLFIWLWQAASISAALTACGGGHCPCKSGSGIRSPSRSKPAPVSGWNGFRRIMIPA